MSVRPSTRNGMGEALLSAVIEDRSLSFIQIPLIYEHLLYSFSSVCLLVMSQKTRIYVSRYKMSRLLDIGVTIVEEFSDP